MKRNQVFILIIILSLVVVLFGYSYLIWKEEGKSERSIQENHTLGANSTEHFDIALSNSEGIEWVFNKDPRIRLPLSKIGLQSDLDIPFLNPEIVLLFKVREKHQIISNDI